MPRERPLRDTPSRRATALADTRRAGLTPPPGRRRRGRANAHQLHTCWLPRLASMPARSSRCQRSRGPRCSATGSRRVPTQRSKAEAPYSAANLQVNGVTQYRRTSRFRHSGSRTAIPDYTLNRLDGLVLIKVGTSRVAVKVLPARDDRRERTPER